MVSQLSDKFNKYILRCDTDKDGNITYVTDPFCKISGYTKDELLTKNYKEIINKDLFEILSPKLCEKLSTTKEWSGEIKGRKKNGSTFWVEVTILPNYDNDDNIIGYESIIHDISSKKEIDTINNNFAKILSAKTRDFESKKKEAEQILASILLPVIITNKRTRKIVYANKYAEDQYGTTLKDMIGSSIEDIYSTENQSKHLLEELNTKGYVAYSQEEFVTHKGKKFTALLSVIPIIYKGEESFIGMVTDITKQINIQNTIKTLLDNAGQGFLYFNKDMKIGAEYSKEAYKIFKQDIQGEDITKLLYEDIDDQEFLKSTLEGILTEDEIRQEILISLLQKEFKINNKFVNLEYKVLNDNRFMMIITDITTKKRLDQKVKDEQQTLKMVIEIVTTKEQFMEVKSDYEKFIDHIEKFKSLDHLSALRREVHTYKGLFAQKEMLHIVKKLHDFESEIDYCLKKSTLNDVVKNITTKDMIAWLELDLSIIKNILGDDYFSKANYMEISRYRLDQLYKKVLDYTKEQNENMLNTIVTDTKNLRYNNIKIFFRPYEKLVEQLGHDLDKLVNPLVTDIDNIYIEDRFIPFINSLVHIFRNSVDHGIETVEDRYEASKNEYGTIKCKVKEKEDHLNITISDDGHGINLDVIKKLAIEKNVYTKKQIEKLSEDEILMIIFQDAFSTSTKITKISGRGVGLASILTELNKLGGKMKIKNSYGNGIKFKFKIPLGNDDEY